MSWKEKSDRRDSKATHDKGKGGEKDNPPASSLVVVSLRIDPDLDNAPPPPTA